MSGYVKAHRSMLGHWVYDNAMHYAGWVAILQLVNWKTARVKIGSEIITLEPGESCMSLATWAEKLPGIWSIKQVRTFFKLLEMDTMIVRKRARNTTRIKVVNWGTYQTLGHESGHAEGTNQGTPRARQGHAKGNNIRREEGEEGEEERKDASFLYIHHSDKIAPGRSSDDTKADVAKCNALIEDYSFDHVEQSIIKVFAIRKRPQFMSQIAAACEEFSQ